MNQGWLTWINFGSLKTFYVGLYFVSGSSDTLPFLRTSAAKQKFHHVTEPRGTAGSTRPAVHWSHIENRSQSSRDTFT